MRKMHILLMTGAGLAEVKIAGVLSIFTIKATMFTVESMTEQTPQSTAMTRR
jgi:hypothetical protein